MTRLDVLACCLLSVLLTGAVPALLRHHAGLGIVESGAVGLVLALAAYFGGWERVRP